MGASRKTVEQRLQELLDQKDVELARAKEQLEALGDAGDWAWARPASFPEDFPGCLLLPRLEIRYTPIVEGSE